jgi:hypothetical protein
MGIQRCKPALPSVYLRGAPKIQFGQLRTNNVVRWEPTGLVLFFVFSQGRDTYTGAPTDYGVQPAFDDVWAQRPQNVFLVKTSYWFGR